MTSGKPENLGLVTVELRTGATVLLSPARARALGYALIRAAAVAEDDEHLFPVEKDGINA